MGFEILTGAVAAGIEAAKEKAKIEKEEKGEKEMPEPQKPSRREERKQQKEREEQKKENKKRGTILENLNIRFEQRAGALKDNGFLRKELFGKFSDLETSELKKELGKLSDQEIDKIIDEHIETWHVLETHKDEIEKAAQPRIEKEKDQREEDVRVYNFPFTGDVTEDVMDAYWEQAEILRSKLKDENKLEEAKE